MHTLYRICKHKEPFKSLSHEIHSFVFSRGRSSYLMHHPCAIAQPGTPRTRHAWTTAVLFVIVLALGAWYTRLKSLLWLLMPLLAHAFAHASIVVLTFRTFAVVEPSLKKGDSLT